MDKKLHPSWIVGRKDWSSPKCQQCNRWSFRNVISSHILLEYWACDYLSMVRGRGNGRPIVRKAILALSDKWLSLATRPMDEEVIIAQMSFIHLGQVDIWFRTSVEAMLLVRRTSAFQISRQPLMVGLKLIHVEGPAAHCMYNACTYCKHLHRPTDWFGRIHGAVLPEAVYVV